MTSRLNAKFSNTVRNSGREIHNLKLRLKNAILHMQHGILKHNTFGEPKENHVWSIAKFNNSFSHMTAWLASYAKVVHTTSV